MEKCIDSIDNEKTSYDAILGGKYVIEDDHDVDNCRDFVNAQFSELMSQIGKVLVSLHANSLKKCRFCMFQLALTSIRIVNFQDE